MTARPVKRRTAMERLDAAVEQYALDYDPPSRRAYRRAVRALLRERADTVIALLEPVTDEAAIRAAVLRGPK